MSKKYRALHGAEAEERNQRILSLRKQGLTLDQISKEVNLDRSRVYQILVQFKEDPRRTWVKFHELKFPTEKSKELLPSLSEIRKIPNMKEQKEKAKALTYGMVWKHIRQGMKQVEIARMYGVDEATVSYRKLQKARSQRKKIVGVSHEPIVVEKYSHLKDWGLKNNPVKIERLDVYGIPAFGGKQLFARKINELINYINKIEK